MSGLTDNQKKALAYDKHIALTANAGSGKTFVFSKRYVEIALNGNVDLDKIVAITFTEKAAAELYSRIAREINERLITETDPEKRFRLERMRQNLVSANISTIHSFCLNVLKENAPDAGLDVNFVPIDESVSAELIEKSIEELFKNFAQSNRLEPEIKYLIRIFGSKFTLVNELTSAINDRKDLLSVKENIYNNTVNQIAARFKNDFEQKLVEYLSDEVEKTIRNIEEINSFAFSVTKRNETVEKIQDLIVKIKKEKDLLAKINLIMSIAEVMLTKSGTVRKKGYLSSPDQIAVADKIGQVEEFFRSVSTLELGDQTAIIEKELARFGMNFVKVFDELFGIYQRKKSENAYLDYEDMLLFTERLVVKPEIQEKLKAKYEYIMIDEYQDTNEVQYNIFMPILENLKKGNLFVVGDEKQSIYMFRGAELEVFNKTKEEIKSGGAPLVLPHSFRMAPNIAAFTNFVFSKLFDSPKLEFNEVKYEEIICAYTGKEKGAVEFLITDLKSEDYQPESTLVTAKILELVREKGLKFSDIAILCRKRSAFEELEKEFVKYDIPYLIIGGKGFYQKQIIYDITNYLTFLLNPNDDKAFVGLLRSPFYTFSDVELYEVSLCEGDSFFEKFKMYAQNNNDAREILNLINLHLSEAAASDIAKLIRKICEDTGYWSVVSAKRNSAQEIANLEKIIAIANNFSNQSFATLYDFVNYLSQSIEKTDDEGQAKILEDADAVNLMTLHKAKGLEFKAVFLYRTADRTQQDRAKSKSIRIDKNFGIMTKVPLNNYFEKYKAAPVVWLSDYVQRRKEIAETKRLLYVGVTRAEEYLFISATANNGSYSNNSFADLLFRTINHYQTEGGYEFSTKLKVAKPEEGIFSEKEISADLHITVTTNIEIEKLKNARSSKIPFPEKIDIEKIIDKEKNEIISASKVAVFSQCPVKYKLTYELGYSKLYSMKKQLSNLYEFNYKEEDEEILSLADVQGRIIHSLLEHETPPELLEKETTELIEAEAISQPQLMNGIEKLRERILSKIGKFYKSEEYKRLKEFENYKNEYEIYAAENDYYLYGIVDKLIIEEDKIIIVDYKSDDVTEKKIDNKIKGYLNQLKFYAYVLSKAYKNIENFELRLIFLDIPENPVVRQLNRSGLKKFGNDIAEIVRAIRNYEFIPNLKHCVFCHYSDDEGKCVLKLNETIVK